jgi:copper oxidase (laccase) domain-containing protein
MTPPSAVRPRLDTWAANRDQLMLTGMQEENIHISGLCTASNVEWFPSFRAEGAGAGRMAGVIRSRA